MADAEGLPELDPGLRRARVTAQLLDRRERRGVTEVVGHLLAVQAQEFRSVPLAIRARAEGLTRADVHAALDSGEVVISWLNRGTLHMVRRDDYPWLLALTSPPTVTANRRRLEQEGVSEAALEKAVALIVKALADGPMLRAELRAILEGKGLPHAALAVTHILVTASLRGLIIRGPVRGREQTWVLVADHLGPLPDVDRDAALRELALRYSAGHSRSSDADLAYWAGIGLRDARAGMAAMAAGAKAAGGAGAKARPARRAAGRGERASTRPLPPRLLPAFDPYIMGWKERSFAIPPAHTERVIPGGGMFRAVVVIDGRVSGTWTLRAGEPKVDLIEEVDVTLTPELEDVRRFG